MTETKTDNIELIDFEVQIPTLEGYEVAEIHTIKVPAKKSPSGNWILTPEALDIIERTQARYMGLLTPEEIKELRVKMQFTQRQMSELIQAGEKSYTRWENGKTRLSRLVNIILCAIRDGYLPITYLQTLCKEGSDWQRKIKTYESQLQRPVIYKVCATPAGVDLTQPVVFTSCPADWGTSCESNWLTSTRQETRTISVYDNVN